MNRSGGPKRVEILSIGEELLGPGVYESNAGYLSGRLQEFGVRVRFRTIVGDQPGEISQCLRQGLERVDLLVATGGLGPTADDRTLEGLSWALGIRLEFSGRLYRNLLRRTAPWRKGGSRALRRQSRVPEGFRVVPNPVGIAPGLLRIRRDQAILLLPGVPEEMRGIFDRLLADRLYGFLPRRRPRSARVLKVVGMPEPVVDRLANREFRKEGRPAPTVLTAPGKVEIVLGDPRQPVTRRLEKRLRRSLGPAVFGTESDTLEGVVAGLLRKNRQTLAIAESCTGGMLGEMITSVPGSSRYFLGGIVAYGSAGKRDFLGVPEEVLISHGAVSRRVAGAMARGSRDRFGASLGISLTGVAGPGGGEGKHPVGTVFVGLAWKGGSAVRQYRFSGTRQQVRRRACVTALDRIRYRLLAGRNG